MSYDSVKDIEVTTNREWNIYNVIHEFIKFRGLSLTSKKIDNKKEFVREFNFEKYIAVEAVSDQKESHVILFVGEDTKYVTHSADFLQLMTKVKADKVMIISFEEKVSSAIQALIKKNKWDGKLFLYPHYMFLTVYPLRKKYPKHMIISQEQLGQDYIQDNPKDHNRIGVMDTMSVWLGAKAGDIISIDRTNQATGESHAYRVATNKVIQEE